MSTEIVRTAFDRVQREVGCEFMDWEGWYWPNHFGDPIAEHRAVREDAGVWDESPLRKWELRGKDALRAADRVFTNDMLGLEIGQVRYGPFCDENGKMVGDGTVFKFADDHAWAITALCPAGSPEPDTRASSATRSSARPSTPRPCGPP
jgi:glycine cleavage system aminomethyltransferase T